MTNEKNFAPMLETLSLFDRLLMEKPIRVGDKLLFSYNDKTRKGLVKSVVRNVVTLESEGSYKSFSVGKIKNIQFLK